MKAWQKNLYPFIFILSLSLSVTSHANPPGSGELQVQSTCKTPQTGNSTLEKLAEDCRKVPDAAVVPKTKDSSS